MLTFGASISFFFCNVAKKLGAFISYFLSFNLTGFNWPKEQSTSIRYLWFQPFLFHFQIISYDSPRGGVSVITEKGDVTASFLVVQHARPSDSGTYSCSPSVGETVSVNVHVLRGKVKHFMT